MQIAAVIPARGGSKGIPKKNIYPLSGKPLIAYTIEAVRNSRVTNDIFVSTDSEEIAKVAASFGIHIINRPPQLSSDTASTESALIHALETINSEFNASPQFVLTLPPTAPLRSADTIRKFISYYLSVSDKYDAMLSLTETRDDHWIKDNSGCFKRLFPEAARRRQDRAPLYIENSAIYITKTESLLTTNSILGRRCTGFVIDAIEAVDINTPIDIQWTEFILKNKHNSYET